MPASDPIPARFRSATEFPRAIDNLSHSDANKLYEEMRECLIFTNRSRGQLLRRNEEHKQSTLQLKADVERLQTLINQLKLDKQQLIQDNQIVISELEREIGSMTGHLDRLSAAFDPVSEDLEDTTRMYWSFLHLPKRFLDFLRTVKAIVLSWREESNNDINIDRIASPSTPKLPGTTEIETDGDRKEHPQMYTDPASIGRDLLDR